MNQMDQLLKEKQYDEVISQADSLLSEDPSDPTALFFKARALICLKQYSLAKPILIKCLQVCPVSQKKWIQEKMPLVRALADFSTNFESNMSKVQEYGENWYEERLLKHIESSTQLSEEVAMKVVKDSDQVFILEGGNYSKDGYCLEGFDREQGRGRQILFKYPLSQATQDGLCYKKRAIHDLSNYRGQRMIQVRFEYEFPVAEWDSGEATIHQPNPKCDVFYTQDSVNPTIQNLLQWSLDRIAKETKDFFVPNYQNIIDPNMTVSNEDNKWTATDFVLEENNVPKIEGVIALQCSVKRKIEKGLPWHTVRNIFDFLSNDSLCVRRGTGSIAGPIANMDPAANSELHIAVEGVMKAAAPMLAKLRRPGLLLPGKVQATVKAQRIYLDPGEDYDGLWHQDGKREDIAAVVIYYYRKSEGLEGGDMEFMSKSIREFWIGGDCTPDSFTTDDHESHLEEIPRCRVPIEKGTLLVFSNYQVVHRVLKMFYPHSEKGDKHAPCGLASRDFLVLFISDQRSPLPSTSMIQEMDPLEERQKMRDDLFKEQIEPSGMFGVDKSVIYSTGNGSLAALGWIQQDDLWDVQDESHENIEGLKLYRAINFAPPLGRGVSWTLELDSWLELDWHAWEDKKTVEENAEWMSYKKLENS